MIVSAARLIQAQEFSKHSMDAKLREIRLNKEKFPHGHLIEFAYIGFDLAYSSAITDEIKSQLMYATLTSKDIHGEIHIDENFRIDHVSFEELAILYRILFHYHQFELNTVGPARACFSKHVKMIEDRFLIECWKDHRNGSKAIDILKGLQDPTFTLFLDRLVGAFYQARELPIPEREVDAYLNQACTNVAVLPSIGLIWYANCFCGLKSTNVPENVKWQILAAAKIYKDASGQVVIPKNFKIEALTSRELACLYRILLKYSIFEKQQNGVDHAIFHAPVQAVLDHAKNLCWKHPQSGREFVEALDPQEDEILYETIAGLHEILLQSERSFSVHLEEVRGSLITSGRARAASLFQSKSKEEPSIDQRLGEVRKNPELLTHGSLILHADAYFNLNGDDPSSEELSEDVKRVVLSAASSCVEVNGAIYLGSEFAVDSLSLHDLIVLYRIISSYHVAEKGVKGDAGAIFHRHLFFIETKLESICWLDTTEGTKAVAGLIKTQDPLCRLLADKLSIILSCKDRFPKFEEDRELCSLFALVGRGEIEVHPQGREKWVKTGEIKEFFRDRGLASTQAQLEKLQKNYKTFLSWLDRFSMAETGEKEEAIKQLALRWKSFVKQMVIEKHTKLLNSISSDFPELFENHLAIYNILAIKPEGMRAIMKRYQDKGIVGNNVLFCERFEDLFDELAKIKVGEDGEWFISLRWFPGVHQAGLYIEKSQGKHYVHIMESTPINADFNTYNFYLAENVVRHLPGAEIYSFLPYRQRDILNCSLFVADDIRELSRNNRPIVEWIRGNAVPVTTVIPNMPDHVKDVRVVQELPLTLLKTAQSLSQVEKALRAPKGPVTDAEARKFAERVRKYKMLDTSRESAICTKAVYGYTELKGMKFRVQIIADVFSQITTL